MKLALYKSIEGNESVAEIDSWTDRSSSYTRISEIIDIEFPLIDVKALELKKVDKDLAAAQLRVKVMENRKAELVAA